MKLQEALAERKSFMKFIVLSLLVIAILSVGLALHYYCSAIEQATNPSIRAEYQSVYDYEKKQFTSGFYSFMNKFGLLCWWLLAVTAVISILLGVVFSRGSLFLPRF